MQLSQDVSLSTIYQPISRELEAVRKNLLGHLRDAFSLISGIGFEKTVVEGKQIRPALALLTGMAAGGKNDAFLIDIAVASEMTHFASLIHDDVVDGAKMRRGSESVNARWHDKVAVLLGDYIISQALYVLSDNHNSGIMRTMMTAIKHMSEGELHQITARSEGIISERDYFSIIEHKTSSLMGAVCKMPVQLIGEPAETVDAMHAFGYNFGMAFQIVDDLLDFVAGEEKLGKPILCDIREGKATLPTICLLSRLDKRDGDRIKKILHERRLEEKDKNWLCEIVRTCAADEYCIEVARDFTAQAKRALDVFPDSEYKKSMVDLCDYIVARER
ncbi:MAG: polyprenyl synthetase family protein [Candidatus Abyssobacteria bacterium SURF_5]|uniref:Polyprenyl synthetase family protein n=1 Tax=Abyssobacteria bacterium (strain SURF_5) TaxID=2093360 RepID=A0A3A4N6Z3_ABYX5|nr:MAG: polyprenyl synthetase family protein [Candidatus Abyssubacteria bacterium SURF_5]